MLVYEDYHYFNQIIFSDESIFHLNGKVNIHNVRIWDSEYPHEIIVVCTKLSKIECLCRTPTKKFHGYFFFSEASVTRIAYLDMLQLYFFPKLQDEPKNFIWQQDASLIA